MTDITFTAPITIRRQGMQRIKLPKLGLGAALEAFTKAMRQALEMTYVMPYETGRRQPLVALDADLNGRDPNW